MRATVGDVASAGAGGIAHALLDECVGHATRSGFAPRRGYIKAIDKVLANRDSRLAASMLERGAPTEADHILGDLLTRSGPVPQSLLQIAYAHLKICAARRRRQMTLARA
jgi:2-dehydropantoate 2-reductase